MIIMYTDTLSLQGQAFSHGPGQLTDSAVNWKPSLFESTLGKVGFMMRLRDGAPGSGGVKKKSPAQGSWPGAAAAAAGTH